MVALQGARIIHACLAVAVAPLKRVSPDGMGVGVARANRHQLGQLRAQSRFLAGGYSPITICGCWTTPICELSLLRYV